MREFIFKTIAFITLPFLACGFGKTVYGAAASADVSPKNLTAFGIGFVFFAVIWRIFKRQLQVICTFEHEATHLLWGLMFLKRPRSFVVTKHDGGYVELSGGENFLITLAPYFFPTVSYLLLPLAFFAPKNSLPVFLGLLGASVAFHLLSTWSELHWRQIDLHEAGILFSLAFLPIANLIFYGALLALILGGAEGFRHFWSIGAWESCSAVKGLFK